MDPGEPGRIKPGFERAERLADQVHGPAGVDLHVIAGGLEELDLAHRHYPHPAVLLYQDAIRRLTRLPAETFKLRERGCFDTGCHADIVIFDAAKIADHATFEKPQQYATGVVHVFVNGVQVLRDGEHTGKKPGQVVRGPGWVGWRE